MATLDAFPSCWPRPDPAAPPHAPPWKHPDRYSIQGPAPRQMRRGCAPAHQRPYIRATRSTTVRSAHSVRSLGDGTHPTAMVMNCFLPR